MSSILDVVIKDEFKVSDFTLFKSELNATEYIELSLIVVVVCSLSYEGGIRTLFSEYVWNKDFSSLNSTWEIELSLVTLLSIVDDRLLLSDWFESKTVSGISLRSKKKIYMYIYMSILVIRIYKYLLI